MDSQCLCDNFLYNLLCAVNEFVGAISVQNDKAKKHNAEWDWDGQGGGVAGGGGWRRRWVGSAGRDIKVE